MQKIFPALTACYHWATYHPEAIPYGLFMLGLSQFRVGDGLLILVGVAAIAGGIKGLIKPPKESGL
jgi:hypothetical protein